MGDTVSKAFLFLHRTLAGKQKKIIEKYAAMVDTEYAKLEASGSSTDPSNNEPNGHDNEQQGSGSKNGFFKNAFGKIKDKLSSDEDDTNDKGSKKKD
jgi:molecular chaperone DnaJ